MWTFTAVQLLYLHVHYTFLHGRSIGAGKARNTCITPRNVTFFFSYLLISVK